MAACTAFIMAFLIILEFKKVGTVFGLAPIFYPNTIVAKNSETLFPARRPCSNVLCWNPMQKKFSTRHMVANSREPVIAAHCKCP